MAIIRAPCSATKFSLIKAKINAVWLNSYNQLVNHACIFLTTRGVNVVTYSVVGKDGLIDGIKL